MGLEHSYWMILMLHCLDDVAVIVVSKTIESCVGPLLEVMEYNTEIIWKIIRSLRTQNINFTM